MDFKEMMVMIAVPFLLFGAGYSIYRFVHHTARTIRNENTPRSTERAAVLSKRMADDLVGETGYSGSMSFYGTFETESGLVLELRMGRRDWGGIQAGDTGLLHWSGDKMELFEKDRA